jgi:FkbM family methyltransferase
MTDDLPELERRLRAAPRDQALYDACRDYAGRFAGENDPDPSRNGEYRVLRGVMPESRVVFDVGAHVGHWCEVVLAINPALEVHAFEPARDSFAALAAKRLAQVKISNIGLGAATGTRELFSFGADTQLRSLYRREGLEDDYKLETPVAGERIGLITLDDYCAAHGVERIDYLKIDTEGHDLQVLRGARAMLDRRAIRIVQFEYGQANIESRDLLKDFFAFFRDYGFNLHKIHAEGYSLHLRYNARLDNFQYQNWLAVGEK